MTFSMTSNGFHYPRVLSIAGSDSGGGAGIQADLKTYSVLGCYGMTAITAITAQNTQGVQAIAAIAPEMVAQQIASVASDIGVDAVKIGMLHDPATVRVVAQAIRQFKFKHVVLDPVMVATSGDRLIAEETIAVLMDELFPLATVITPNLDEVALLLGLGKARLSASQFPMLAQQLSEKSAASVLIKGGHLLDEQLVDVLLYWDENSQSHATQMYTNQRIDTPNTHGTGCTLSSAIACFLALGESLPDAVGHAHHYTYQAIVAGAQVTTGRGHGPLNHAFAPVAMCGRA
ncbi:Hydroxymethylpyrimidine/phosphomethylpyrimidine kinase [Ephemeroptericola cinctiostellae]|uniref:hydroxymethylpyrimidine kinase n=1 Tax=Ephemeroptericola cinctiostellae TaxID=2268024 RepID=A0A345DB41_9BURK|nr:bifunctional hydroxymethylpyrimidine kinase/phosphomethylpyrimidine kinase [Ephemeroptericola cinctiostellae]AXF85579.1 Hydroxymethylpyrimidine/phosphomethylpyrimidine kinase [Ephemeroptericola cinctiostellae]